MTREELRLKSKNEILDFIKNRIAIKNLDNQLKEFESKNSASSSLNILDRFEDLNIYEITSFLIMENKTLYIQYQGNNKKEEIDLSNLSTSEIIYKVFEKTIFLNRQEY